MVSASIDHFQHAQCNGHGPHSWHGIRSRLTEVLGYSELLAQGMVGGLSDDQRRMLDRIFDSSQAILAAVDAMQCAEQCRS